MRKEEARAKMAKRLPRRDLGAWWTAETEAEAKRLPELLTLDTMEQWDGENRRPWQRAAHAAILGLGEALQTPLVWIDGPTGCGKDQIIAAAVLAILHRAPQGFRAIMQSTDHDRACDVIDAVRGFISRTESLPALGQGIEFTRNEIRHPERDIVIECVATDGASASGARADLYILNEVQSWKDPGGHRVFTETLARYRKKQRGRFVVLSNLPFTPKGDWRRDAWEKARKGKGWAYIPVRLKDCPWIDREYIEEQRANLPDVVFRRLYLCEPTDGRGELVTVELYARAERIECAPAAGPTLPGNRFYGVDIGIARDHAAGVLLRADPAGAVFLERVDLWVPDRKAEDEKLREVQIAEVEAKAKEYGKSWGARVLLDPYQAIQLEQNLKACGIEVERVDATPLNLTQQASAVMSLFRDGRIRVYPGAGQVVVEEGHETSLRQQLLDAEMKETERGIRIVSKRTKLGHGDQASAFQLAALGIARAEVFSIPACVGSPRAAAPDDRGPRRTRPDARMFRHDGRFLGARAPRRRIA